MIRGKDGNEKVSKATVLLLEQIDLNGKLYFGSDSWAYLTQGQPIPREPSEFSPVYEPEAVNDIREDDEVVAWRVYL
jgi:hypothetical protein